jgi:hypothetical protein
MITPKLDVGSSSPLHAQRIQKTKHHGLAQTPISESDFTTINCLLLMSGTEWHARHVNVPARCRNVVIITKAQPTEHYTENLLIAPYGDGYLVFFHAATRYDADEDYVVSSCQSMLELCRVISGHCNISRKENFTYAGVPRISGTEPDDLCGAIPDEW